MSGTTDRAPSSEPSRTPGARAEPDNGGVGGTWTVEEKRECLEQTVTDILVALDHALEDNGEESLTGFLPEEAAGPLVDDLREAIMRELLSSPSVPAPPREPSEEAKKAGGEVLRHLFTEHADLRGLAGKVGEAMYAVDFGAPYEANPADGGSSSSDSHERGQDLDGLSALRPRRTKYGLYWPTATLSRRWRRLEGSVSLSLDPGELVLPRPYLYRDAPLMFGVTLGTKHGDAIASIDFLWHWRSSGPCSRDQGEER